MEVNYQDLRALIISDPPLAIDYCKVIISTTSNFKNFHEFINFHFSNSRISACQDSWSTGRLSIHCPDCGIDVNSCICLECFLNSNHQGHEYYISKSLSGNCDCGDSNLWKRSGFCTNHQGLDEDSHPENYLDEKLRTFLIDVVFKSFLGAIQKIGPNDITTLSEILQFLELFLKFGDGFRRLLVISLTEKINFEKFLNRIFEVSLQFNQRLVSFFSLLINDELFKKNFSKINYKLMINKVIPLSLSITKGIDFEIYKNSSPWINFWYLSYIGNQFKIASESFNWNWIEFIIQLLNYSKELFSFKELNYCKPNYVPRFFRYIFKLAEFSMNQTEEEKQILFDQFVIEILSKKINNTIITTTFDDINSANIDFQFIKGFDRTFYGILKSFKFSKKIEFERMFELFDKALDISSIFMIGKNVIGNGNVNENDRFVYHYIKTTNNNFKINDNHYKSFSKGSSSFFVSNPLIFSLAHLLRNDEYCRLKIAEYLSLEKYQSVRIQIGIAVLKSLLALVCLSQSLVPNTNSSIHSILSDYLNEPKQVSFGIPRLFPLLQLIIGIQCIENNKINEFSFKEFFAFEMAREIGIFDEFNINFNEGIKKQMIFSFLYLSLLLVTDRILFNFDGFKFNKEQIIFELKQGVSDLNELNDLFDANINSDLSNFSILNRIIHEVATPRQNSKNKNIEDYNQNNVSFELKEGVCVNFISAINSFNKEKTLMDSEIKKHPDQLIKIQPFEPEESYFFNHSEKVKISLKEFLITPTVFSIVYKTLRNSSESHTNELNDHLAMNILLLISKFVDDSNFQCDNSIKPDKVIKYKSTIVDLIMQLERSVFNYTIDRNGSSSIKNTINKEAFNLLLKMKISSSNETPKSIVDILIEKGELGKNVLKQMGIKIDNDEDKSKQDEINQMKKNRAKQMKENILIHFKSLSSSFSLNESSNNEEDDNDEKENVCSICSLASKNEILSYPLYIYRTKFPFIFDKPPILEMTRFNSMKEADILQDFDVLQPPNINEDDFEDKNDKVPDVDSLMIQILAENPSLDINSDMTEEQQEHIRQLHDQIYQAILKKHEEMVQQAKERKNQRKQLKINHFQREKKEFFQKLNELKNPNSIVYKCCTAGNNFVIQFGICQHLIHPNCVQQDHFTCPIDRSFKNGFLPNIDDLTDDVIYDDKNSERLSEKLKEALNIFINKYSYFFRASENKILDLFVELVKSLSGLITTYEVRLRSLPDCLDSKKTKVLARNLFLTTWYAYRMRGKPTMKTGFDDDVSENVDVKLTVFQRFIKKLIETDEIEKNVSSKNDILNQLVSSFIQSSSFKNEKEKFLFLRRVCLADHFLLKNKEEETRIGMKNNDFIDWDEVLSLQNLSQKFNASFKSLNDEFEFKPFNFSQMPKEFLRFAEQPYNFPVDLYRRYTFCNILNYNKLIEEYDDLDENADFENDYRDKLYQIDGDKAILYLVRFYYNYNYPSVLLSVGKGASSVLVIDGKRMCYLRPFYLDKYGCADIDFCRSQPLFLNEERSERVMDQILSGEFTSNLKPFEQFDS